MSDVLPHLRRKLHELECVAERYRAEGSAFADLLDGDIAVLAEKVVEAERTEGAK